MIINNILFKIGNILYKHSFPLYWKLYNIYKNRNDAYEISLFKHLIKSGDTVINIGANVGFYDIIFLRLVHERGTLHSFEPDPVNFSYLKKVTSGYKNIKIYNLAISDENKKLKLYVSSLFNTSHKTYLLEKYSSIIEIDSISVDNYINNKFIADFIKIDVEGAELNVLKGMSATIKSNPQLIIFMEYWPYGMAKANFNRMEMLSFIKSFDLNIYLIQHNSITEGSFMFNTDKYDNSRDKYFNLLLTRKNLQEMNL